MAIRQFFCSHVRPTYILYHIIRMYNLFADNVNNCIYIIHISSLQGSFGSL